MAHGPTNSRKAAMLNAYFDSVTLWLGISSTEVDETGTTGINEPADLVYARQQLTGSDPDWAAATVADPSIKSNIGTITFPQAEADWFGGASFQWWFLSTAVTGGTIEWRGQLRDARIILDTDTLRFDANELDVMLGDDAQVFS